jgi:hypothetical protein
MISWGDWVNEILRNYLLIPTGFPVGEEAYYQSVEGVARAVRREADGYTYRVRFQGHTVARGKTKTYAGATLTASKYMRDWIHGGFF